MLVVVRVSVPGGLEDMRGSQVVRGVILAALALLLLADLSALFGVTQSASTASTETANTASSSAASDVDVITSQESTGYQYQGRKKQQKLSDLAAALKSSCLPKLICELNATPDKERLSPKAKSLLQLIRDTTLGGTGEGSSRYHFAAHMGQLISGVDGTGCHNFYPSCPLPGSKVLSLLSKPSGLSLL